MRAAALSRFSRGGYMQLLQCRRFSAPIEVCRPQQNAVTQTVASSGTVQTTEPLASSFIQPLPIPGIRRAPRTPTLPEDSKFREYAGPTGDRLFPFVLTASFLIPMTLITKYF